LERSNAQEQTEVLFDNGLANHETGLHTGWRFYRGRDIDAGLDLESWKPRRSSSKLE
jgi:hypothetical protein